MNTLRVGRTVVWAAVVTTALGVASAQHRRHPEGDVCSEGQHRSGTHCCNPGEAWVDEREACVCLDPHGCVPPAPPVPVAAPTQPPAAPVHCPEGMVSIPGGSFFMGGTAGEGDAAEQPQHRVTLSPYCIDRDEVTTGQYRACAQTGACTTPFTDVSLPGISVADRQLYSGFCNGSRTDRDNHPINCVDWAQADAYCHAQHGRLPTEAEWEFAARGTTGRRYPWGDAPPAPRLLNACDSGCRSLLESPTHPQQATMFEGSDTYDNTAPVGSYLPGASPFGLLDMAGNVMEWTADWFGPYTSSAATDPGGAESGSGRVVRGGSWVSSNPDVVRGGARTLTAASNRLATLGFRCVYRPDVAALEGSHEAPGASQNGNGRTR